MAYQIQEHAQLQDKSLTHRVTHLWGPWFQVVSGASGHPYNVNAEEWSCGCARQPYISQHMNEGVNGCSHVMAAIAFIKASEGKHVIFRPADEPVKHLKREVIRVTEGDNVIATARKGLREKDAPMFDDIETVDDLNDLLFN